MNLYNLNDFKGGWVVGDFDPSIIKSKDVEVAIKRYKAGDSEPMHHHKEADELTIIIDGSVKMNNQYFGTNDVILVHKHQIAKFDAVLDTITCVIKMPSVIGDKYIV